MRIGRFTALLAALALAACGGGGDSPAPVAAVTPIATATPTPTPTPTPTATATPVANQAAVVLDAGPAVLNTGANPNTAFNSPFVTITVCAPGSTTNCQTIDHVILDTGSVGLRLIQPVLNASLLAALPLETDGSNNPVGECYEYVNSYAFGSVRVADFSIAGEKVANMPFQAIADTGAFANAPSACTAGGGSAITSVQAFGANGILGVGTTTTDCGSYCTVAGNSSAAIYYDCPASGCGSVIARASNAAAPFQQLPNPVAAFPVDNNGTILSLPTVSAHGAVNLTGTITFGIGTQSNNMLSASHVLTITDSNSRLGPGVLTATYNGKQLTQSFLDSGSDEYYFIDTTLPACTAKGYEAYYCPPSPTMLSPFLTSTSGIMATASVAIYDPTLTNYYANSTAGPGFGVNPTLVKPPLPFQNSFDFGIPFFFGKTVYTAIEGRAAGGTPGPYFAF